jgi:hypothetical protein
MAKITMDWVLFRWLVRRWLRLEIEDRGIQATLVQARLKNPTAAKEFEAVLQMTTDDLPPSWIAFEAKLQEAMEEEDAVASLGFLSLFVSQMETRQESDDSQTS